MTAHAPDGKPGYVNPGARFVNGSPLQFALRELRASFSSPRTLGVLLIVVVALGLAGPFGTFQQLSVAGRLGYWAAIALATYAVGVFFGMLALAVVRPHTDSRPLLTLAIALAACLPVTLVVLGVNMLMVERALPTPSAFVELLLNCFFIVLGIAVLVVLASPRPRQDAAVEQAAPAPAEPSGPILLKRLPLPQRGALRYLSMQDHYVDVVTDKGHALLLMRLSDAIAETAPTRGLQIHRSHWIALDAVRSVSKGEGKAVVEMADGTKLAISRSYVAAAREAGLFV